MTLIDLKVSLLRFPDPQIQRHCSRAPCCSVSYAARVAHSVRVGAKKTIKYRHEITCILTLRVGFSDSNDDISVMQFRHGRARRAPHIWTHFVRITIKPEESKSGVNADKSLRHDLAEISCSELHDMRPARKPHHLLSDTRLTPLYSLSPQSRCYATTFAITTFNIDTRFAAKWHSRHNAPSQSRHPVRTSNRGANVISVFERQPGCQRIEDARRLQ